jgi:hypothetical protein
MPKSSLVDRLLKPPASIGELRVFPISEKKKKEKKLLSQLWRERVTKKQDPLGQVSRLQKTEELKLCYKAYKLFYTSCVL